MSTATRGLRPMPRRRGSVPGALLAAALLALAFVPGAHAAFGVEEFAVSFDNADGTPVEQAGSHPFSMSTRVRFATHPSGEGGVELEEAAKDILTAQAAGFVGNPTVVPVCSAADFLRGFLNAGGQEVPSCPDSTALGIASARLAGAKGQTEKFGAVYNLAPPPGKASKLGFWIAGAPVTIELGLAEAPPYDIVGGPTNISQLVEVTGATLTLWGVPADPAHDPLRGHCLKGNEGGSLGVCKTGLPENPFLTMPRSCSGPLLTGYEADSWLHPGAFVSGLAESGQMRGCGRLGFGPAINAEPTSRAATSPSGLDFSLEVEDEGLVNPSYEAVADSDVEKVVATLPEGMSANPALAEGLATCSEADLARETAFSEAGAGCPAAAKVGSVEVETPVLEGKILKGSLYVATPYENPFNSLLALYIVIQEPKLGIVVKVPLRVQTDPESGQITTVAEDLPPFPVSHFRLHFREGTRSPLATPPLCGTYDGHDAAHEPLRALLYPSSGAEPVESTSSFEIVSGPNAGPCPSGGLPPFHPDLVAGTLNNAAGSFSPFNVKITRSDSEQEITRFSIKLPPGVAGKLAGLATCSDAAIAKATSRIGPHGGAEELNDPSCPASSQVGRTLAGAGVGPSLAYAPGKVYLAGPYHGAPISFVSITSGVVGPFDIGTVVVRLAIRVNPETGEVFLDSVGSDPIPHIIKGIPLHLRDIRAYTDRPSFTFNPTSCERKSTAATVLGSGLDFASGADDNPFVSTSPFQAADCAALPFAPKLSLRLIGGTRRGAHPALKAFLRMGGFGEAGVAKARVTLPRSEFIENAHFNTICTRVQFKEQGGNGEACPAGSIYGWARAKTPILQDPLEGPIFLRSSEHELPDVVASLRGQQIDVHLVGHVDSVKGQLRNTFETVPDAPVEWASFNFQGQKKGLFVNSTNLCKRVHRAKVEFTGQNGKRANYGAPLKVKCKKHKAKKKQAKHKRARR